MDDDEDIERIVDDQNDDDLEADNVEQKKDKSKTEQGVKPIISDKAT